MLAPHVTASAKAILAFQSEELIDRALKGPLPKLTPETKVARKEIEADYEAVRENGFATCWNEVELGLGAIAIPIPLPDVGVIYSVATAGLIDRLTRRSLARSLKVLRSAIEPLSKAMSERSPTGKATVTAAEYGVALRRRDRHPRPARGHGARTAGLHQHGGGLGLARFRCRARPTAVRTAATPQGQ